MKRPVSLDFAKEKSVSDESADTRIAHILEQWELESKLKVPKQIGKE